MRLGLFASSLGDGADHWDEVLLLFVLVVVSLQQSLTHLYSHTVIQLMRRLLVV